MPLNLLLNVPGFSCRILAVERVQIKISLSKHGFKNCLIVLEIRVSPMKLSYIRSLRII
jgi:hypothetical protein